MRFSPLQAGHRPHAKEAIMQPRHGLQRNLFEEDRKTPDIPAALRSVVVRLIEGLLVEALTDGASSETRVATTGTREAAHEQDHA
jgi:hypothetical protein